MAPRGLNQIETELHAARGADRARLQAELAWTLRWDHPERAAMLAEEVLDGTVAGDEAAEAWSRLVLANRARLRGDYESSGEQARIVLGSPAAAEDRLLRGIATAFLAGLHHAQGRQAAARELLDEVLAECEDDERSGTARIYLLNERGRSAFALCEWASAADSFARALELARREGDQRMEGTLHVNIGNVLSELRDTENCLEHYRKALHIHRLRADADGQSLALHNLAVVHARTGDRAEAERCCREALRFVGAGGRGPAPTGLLLAEQLVERNELEEAREHASQVLRDAREHGQGGIAAQALTMLAGIERERDRNEEAGALLRDALESLKDVDDRVPDLLVHIELSRVELATGRPAAARAAAEQAVEEARALETASYLVVALACLEKACERDGDIEAALQALRERHAAESEDLRRAAEGRSEVLRTRHELDRALQREQDLESRRDELELEVARRTEALQRSNEELESALAEKQRGDREREQLADQLRHAQKMEAVGRLAGGIAHDFNNLLTVMRGHSELLAGSAAAGTDDHESARHMLDACDRAGRLTSQLLAFSRNRPREQAALDGNAVLIGLRDMLQRLLGEDIRLELELDEQPAWIEADPGSIEQVLLNLAVNARDAMPKGGTLKVGTNRRNYDSPVQANTTEHVVLSVTDTGSGIGPELLELIFEPFFTTKPAGEGTGLGLATSYGLVRQAGGTILVTSTPGSGTTFEVLLPERPAPLEAPAERRKEAPASDQPPRRVLLVEDDPSVRRLLRSGLESFGHEVVCAADGLEALESLADDQSGFDVIVSDVVMPRMGGPELLGRLLEEGGHPPMVLTSGWPDRAAAPPGRAGADYAFLEKPFRLRALSETIETLLAGG